MRTSAGIPAFRSVEDAALAQWLEDHPLPKVKSLTARLLTGSTKSTGKTKRKRDSRVEKIWIGEELPNSALIVIRHISSQESPFPQFSFYRVDKRSLQCWHIEDDARRERLLSDFKAEKEAKGSDEEIGNFESRESSKD